MALACGTLQLLATLAIGSPESGAAAIETVFAGISATIAWVWMLALMKLPAAETLRNALDERASAMQKQLAAEEFLATSQRHLGRTLAEMGAGFIAADGDGSIIFLNRVAEQVLGWSLASARGQALWRVFVAQGKDPCRPWAEAVEDLIDDEVPSGGRRTLDVLSHAGKRTNVEANATLLRSTEGAVQGCSIVFRDVHLLRTSQAETLRLAAVVESSVDAIVGMDLDGRISSWNGAAETLYGYTADEAIGQSVRMLVPPEREKEEDRVLATIVSGAGIASFDSEHLTRNGRIVDVSLSISPVRSREGTIIGGSKIVRDVTATHQAELALRNSEARLRLAIDAASVGCWDLDLGTLLGNCSRAHDNCFGYEHVNREWTLNEFASRVHPLDRSAAMRTFEISLHRRRDLKLKFRVLWPDGTVHWIRVRASVIVEDGKATRMLGVSSDITHELDAEEARLNSVRLEVENALMHEAANVKGLFIANMSHELRTPLNAIIGFSELLQLGGMSPDSPKHAVFLGHIADSGRHLLALINEVLDVAKIDAGKFTFHPEPTDLSLLVQAVVATLEPLARKAQVSIVTEMTLSPGEIVLDAMRLKQVLLNFLSNAVKFSLAGGRITVRAMDVGSAEFRIEVQDAGIGIAEVDLTRLFVDFQQLDSSRSKRHEGTGLGLALSRRLIEAQGGRVGVRSVLGEGSVFDLVLPRQAVASLAHVSHPAEAAASADSAAHFFGRGELQEVGCAFQGLADEAIRQNVVVADLWLVLEAFGRAYDSLTLDVLLPTRRGVGVFARARQESGGRQDVVSIGNSDNSMRSCPIADTLSKPIRTDEIAAAMKTLQPGTSGQLKVVVIDDDPCALALMEATLRALGVDAICLNGGPQALQEVEMHLPDAIILDLVMPGVDGFAVLEGLRHTVCSDTPVFIWTGMILTGEEMATLARSARAVFGKGQRPLVELLDGMRLSTQRRAVAVDPS